MNMDRNLLLIILTLLGLGVIELLFLVECCL